MPGEAIAEAIPSMTNINNLFVVGAVLVFAVILYGLFKVFMEGQ